MPVFWIDSKEAGAGADLERAGAGHFAHHIDDARPLADLLGLHRHVPAGVNPVDAANFVVDLAINGLRLRP